MSRRVLVTGGAGFIGSHVAERHVAAGDDVWIVDDLSSGRMSNIPAGARFVQLDIRSPELAGVFRDAGGFDVVSHHAAQIDVRVSVADPRRDAGINIDGLLNLLEACVAHGCGRFVYVSSGGVVYGEPAVRPTPETSPKLPLSPYGVSKLAGEQYLHYYANVRGLDYAALRYSNVYGPRQDPHGEAGVVAIFCTRIAAGAPLSIFGDGRQTRDYVYVGDVAAANVLAATAELPPPVDLEARAWNVGTGTETSVNDLARKLMAAADRQVAVEMEDARPGELRHSCLDASRIGRLGWAPAVTLEQGLGLTYRHITGQEAAA
jgi:UDP-glucose 4-epimerase